MNNSSGGEIEYEDKNGTYHMLTEDGVFTIYNEEQDDIEFIPYDDLSKEKLNNIISNLKSEEYAKLV